MTESKSFVFRFGDVEVHEREFSLVKAGEVLPIEPKAFRVLLFLLHNPQKLIRKEELLNALWADAAVTESSLTRSIAKLRRALGDDFQEPRYIETVTTVGYRFVCKVEVVADDSGRVEGIGEAAGTGTAAGADASLPAQVEKSGEEAIAAKAQQAGARRLRRRWLLAGAGILVAGLGCLLWYLQRPQPPLRISGFTQITRDGRHKGLFGSDATTLYFNRYPESQPIYRVAMSGGEIEHIPIPLQDPWLVDVSHADSSFLVLADFEQTTMLWIVQPSKNSPRQLAEGSIESAAWSPDGKSVIYSLDNGDINVVRADGSGAHRLAKMENMGKNPLPLRFSWSPDGGKIRFDRNDRIYEISADGTGLHEFLPNWRPAAWQCCGQWTPNGRLFIFLEWDTPVDNYLVRPSFQLWALDERPGLFQFAHPDPFQLTTSPIRWGRPMSATDGKKIYAHGEILRAELVRYDPQSHELQTYLGGTSAEGVTFSKDGRYIAYVAYPEGILCRANRDGSNPVQLSRPPFFPALPHWSPDGTQILFFATDAGGRTRSYVIPAHGGDPHALLPEDTRDEEGPEWSPDGRKVVFFSDENNDPSKGHLRILDLASRQMKAIPASHFMIGPHWSPDGRFIVARHAAGEGASVFDLKTAQWSAFEKGDVEKTVWSRDSQFIYFLRVVGDAGVFRIRPSGGAAERVVDLKGFRWTSASGHWMGLDPEDKPILLRDVGTDDIYALTLDQK